MTQEGYGSCNKHGIIQRQNAGHIAAESKKPRSGKLTEMGKYVSVAVMAINAIIFITGMLKGKSS